MMNQDNSHRAAEGSAHGDGAQIRLPPPPPDTSGGSCVGSHNCYCNYCSPCCWPSPLINSSNMKSSTVARSSNSKRRGRNKLQICHRKHKRFEYDQPKQQMNHPKNQITLFNYLLITTTVISILLPLLTSSMVAGLDSPVKVQRFKQQSSGMGNTLGSSQLATPQQANSTQSSLSSSPVDRVRRTNPQLPATSHSNHTAPQQQASGNRLQDECPPAKLIQSLLPADYHLHQSSASNAPRAHCDCVKDLYGWYVTCYAGLAASSANLASVASLPNQLHPAFRGPQLQRQAQQQQAAAAAAAASSSNAHRRFHRSAPATAAAAAANINRWSGDDEPEGGDEAAGGSSSSSSLLPAQAGSSPGPQEDSSAAASHEGFGDEPTTAASPVAPETVDARQHQRKAIPRQHLSNISLTDIDSDSFVLSPSSNSFTLLQPQDLQDLQDHRSASKNGSSSSISRMNEKMTQLANNDNNNIHQVMFQTVPVLFSVKYTRNNLIEIDCDQAAPHYKPAMFQGFNVNEISSFTFNNCQLPNIPYSALLHRTRSPLAAATGGAAGQPASGGSRPTTGGGGQQALKPTRLRHQNLLRRKRHELEAAEPHADNDSPIDGDNHPQPSSQQATPNHQSGSRPTEPRVRSLTVNLNTVVNQRTLMSLLAGLDLLEELQLNYMQLNLTNYEPELETDPTAPTTSSETIATAAARTSSPTLLMVPASIGQQQAQAATPNGATASQPQAMAPSTGSGSLSTTTTTTTSSTTTSTTAAPMQILLASSGAGSSPTQTPVLTMPTSNARPPVATTSRSPTMAPQMVDQMVPSQPPPTTTTAASTTTTPTTTTTTTTTGRPPTQKPKQQQQQQAAIGPRPTQTTATRPSLGLVGAPRGLMYSQASGQPNNAAQTTTPTPTSSALVSGQAQATSAAPQTTVPSVQLVTVMNHQQQQYQTQRQTNSPNTNQTPGDRTSSPPTITISNNQNMNNNNNNNNRNMGQSGFNGPHISVASSQTQTVSYTSQSASQMPNRGNQQQQLRQQQQPQTTVNVGHQMGTTNGATAGSGTGQAPTTSGFMGLQQASNQLMAGSSSPAMRLHHSPTGWFQATSQPSQQQGPTGLTTPVNMPQTTTTAATSRQHAATNVPTEAMTNQLTDAHNRGDLQTISSSSTPSSSPTSAMSSQWNTQPTTSTSNSIATNGNHQNSQLNAPANTPYASVLHTNGFGIRTSQASGPLPVSLNLYNSNSPSVFRTTVNQNTQAHNTQMTNAYAAGLRGMNTNQFTQPVTTTTTTSSNGIGNTNRRQAQQSTTTTSQAQTMAATDTNNPMQFVAAGGRLPANMLAMNQQNHRSQQHQPTIATTTTSSSPSAAATSNAHNQRVTSNSVAPPTTSDQDLMSLVSGSESNGGGSGFATSTTGSSSASSAFLDELETPVQPPPAVQPFAGHRLHGRHKRQVNSEATTMEEFELSFGELLPNLRYLRLQSFIDLSKAASQPSPKDNARKSTTTTTRQTGVNRRFRRQFQPDDMPEKDEGHMSDSESAAIAATSDSLLAEETSVHHNSVMASSSDQHRQQPPNNNNNDISTQMISRSGLIEPLSRANRNSTHFLSADLSPAHEEGEPLQGRSSSGNQPSGDSHLMASGMDSEESSTDQQQQQQFQRIKRYSQVLVKMFSKLAKLRHLHLDRNDIPYWPDNVLFDSRHSLNRLYLLTNNIRLLGRNSLANLTELETLDLSLNQLRQLNGDMFRDLSGLRNFRACCNLFRRLPSRLFGQIPSIKPAQHTTTGGSTQSQSVGGGGSLRANRLDRLDFSKNPHLSQLSADLFAAGPQQPPTSVTTLTFSNCALTDQLAGKSPKALFASLPDLISITLRGNKLRDLLATNGLFAKNSRLQSLNVSHNQLASLSANLFNTNASQLMELQLEHNQLVQIPDQFLFNLRKLRKLSMAHNRLTHLSAYLFINNEQIESIDLSHNQLVTLNTQLSQMMPFGTGQKLRHLNLAHNNLTQFKADIFDINWIFYTHLTRLDLSNNRFEGQISMPIFHTIADEMLLNLASNSIQSVSVDDLKQHDEHPLDRYATNSADSLLVGGSSEVGSMGGGSRQSGSGSGQATTKVPTVSIRLTGNPIACDCLLEPLISYSRRVAAATNPTLEAHFFAQKSPSHPDGSLEASSRYSVLTGSHSAASAAPPGGSGSGGQAGERNSLDSGDGSSNLLTAASAESKQPPVFYQFKFNDLYCAKPSNLQRQLLSHVSISDLLCPIRDQRLCPRQCKCDYQSAFRTAFVDCDNQQLSSIPEQLTDASNFIQFNIEPSFSTPPPNQQHQSPSTSNLSLPIASVDKVVIYLRNNKLRSMEQLAKLFTVTASNRMNNNIDSHETGAEQLRPRFARAPAARGGLTSATAPQPKDGDASLDATASAELLTSVSAQPLTLSEASDNSSQQPSAPGTKKVVSPAMIGRSMHGASGRQAGGARQRRQTDDNSAPNNSNNNGETPDGFDTPLGNHLTLDGAATATVAAASMTTTSSSLEADAPISTAVLESAEEFRNKRYPMTCELHLDHNLIESIPESFLDKLDHWRSSAIHSTLTAPQAALPTMMQEPPIHTRLHHLSGASSDASSSVGGAGTAASAAAAAENGNLVGDSGDASEAGGSPEEHLFGRPPFTPERKAALMESINQKVRINQMQRSQQLQQPPIQNNHPDPATTEVSKVSISPALVVLSLRFNNLANINAKMLQRLSKLIMSSNTKFYFGHNPFNCTDNYAMPASPTDDSTGGMDASGHQQRPAMLPVSPMGDQLVATSDSASGAYLESMAEDLTPSASSSSDVSSAAPSGALVSGLSPADCPVGQLKSWITRHRANIDDLDEIYCVRMTPELADKLKLATNMANNTNGSNNNHHQLMSAQGTDTSHPSMLMMMQPWTLAHNGSQLLEKGGLSWNGELLAQSAKLVDVNVYDLCPYSGVQILDPAASGLLSPGHQQAIISLAIVFILISMCLLLMLIYFGDTQTILAFVYIHMNPIYSCLRLNESHLDGEKLYDAFVSYSSADRDIVMELIERLEQQPNLLMAADGPGGDKGGLDFKSDTIVGADGRQQVVTNTNGTLTNNNNSNTLNRRTNSFQDLSTMSRSTSRIMMGSDEFGGSALEMSHASQLNTSGQEMGGQMMKGGQAGAAPYRLCIHERDWLPGHLISWNIVNSVQNSRRTILILSKEFIKSVWFQVEFHTAYYQMLEDKIDRLIVIVRGELPPKAELDKNLAFLLTTKTYLTWGEKWFWERLHYALPHRSIPPAVRGPHATNTAKKHHLKASGPKHYHQAPGSAGPNKQSTDLTASLAGSGGGARQQRPLVMSSIGKDCSNLLLPVHHHHNHHQAQIGSSASSSGSSASNTRSSASFLSGSSSGNLLSPTTTSPTQTTTNDLLSAAPTTTTTNTTRLTIGPKTGQDQSSQDSGRMTGHHLSSSSSGGGGGSGPLALGPMSPNPDASLPGAGVTSILVDGAAGLHASSTAAGGANSKVRAKKQEKLQNFVDKTISSHFNLSEL